MKKKLNLLWNLKFNFFSVAERPLTFFAYFLNAKKVGRRRLVIGPAKAGAFLFSHTRLPFPPRPLLPFGRISPAAKPRVRLPAPPGPVFCRPRHGCAAPGPQRQKPGARRLTPPFRLRRNRACGHRPHLLGLPRKIRRGISLRETTLCGCPLRGHGFATPHRYFAVPVTAAPRRGPNGKTPALFGYFLNTKKVGRRRLVIGPAKAGAFLFSHTRLPLSPRPLLPFGRISPAAKPRGRSSAPPGPLFCRSRHGCAAPGPQRQKPGALWLLS